MLGSLDGTSRAIETLPIETLRDVAGLSLVFNLVRDFTESILQGQATRAGEANSIRPSSPGNSTAVFGRGEI